MKKYQIQDREAGNIIEDCKTYQSAIKQVVQYELIDKAEGNYTYDFYEIVEVER